MEDSPKHVFDRLKKALSIISDTDQESDDTIKGRSESFLAISEKLNQFLEEDLEGRGNSESWYLDQGHGSLAYYSSVIIKHRIRIS